MAYTLEVLAIAFLSILGAMWILRAVLDFFVFGRDTSTTVKIVDVPFDAENAEFSLRKAKNELIRTGLEKSCEVLLVCSEESTESAEVCQIFCKKNSNFILCTPRQARERLLSVAFGGE